MLTMIKVYVVQKNGILLWKEMILLDGRNDKLRLT